MAGTELKPCPFCGGEAFLNDDPTGNGGKPHMSGNVGLGRLWSVECDECGADAGFWQDRNVAIAAWNTRAEMGYEDVSILLDELGVSERTCQLIDDSGLLHCSECGGVAEERLWAYWHYCPNCGAKVVSE